MLAQPINALKRNLLFLPCSQIECGIREIDRLVRADDHIIGTVEPLSLETVREDFVLAIRAHFNDGT